jgi:deferrochelatase/peroxidase EfeB
MTPRPAVDLGDVQGLVRYGHGHMTEARFFLLRIADPRAARAWLRTAPVTPAVRAEPRPRTALHVAFTHEGLEALGVPAPVIAGFSPEFVSGIAGDESRSRRLGDVGANAPSGWQWGGPGRVPHVLALVYAEPGLLEAWTRTVMHDPWNAAFHLLSTPPPAPLDGVEAFGFVDGISQPVLDWDRARIIDGRDQIEYGNVAALGEFLLGYPNEYGQYTARPLIDAADDPRGELPPAEDAPGRRDVGGNGTYLVMRQLRQDVRGFWQFLQRQANGDARARQALAEAMVGRAMSGEPLVAPAGRMIPGVDPQDPDDVRYNQFTFESDPHGIRCPLGAHVRRANPRNADLPGHPAGLVSRLVRTLGFGRMSIREDVLSSTRFHRILRRGREYGPSLPIEEAIRPGGPDDPERGLYFIALSANIARQFEFVQSAWLVGTKFGGLAEESDPLTGTRERADGRPATDTFSLARDAGVRRRITGLPQFVTVRGGAYFFLPGVRALRYLTGFGG